MAQRAAVNHVCQFGVETVHGTAVAANRILRSIHFMPKYSKKGTAYTPKGHRYPTVFIDGKEMAMGTFEGLMCYNAFLYVLASLVTLPSVAAIGAAATAKKWTLAPSTTAIEDGKSLTFEAGDGVKVDQFPNGLLTSMTGDFGQDDVKISGDLIAKRPTFNATQTASPTAILPRPVKRSHIKVYLDTAFGSIGTTQVAQVMQEQLVIGKKKHEVWAHSGTTTWDDIVDVPVDLGFSLVTPHNSQSRTYLDNISTAGTQFLRVQCIGDQIDLDGVTPVKETITLDMAGHFDEPDQTDEEDAYAYRYNFKLLHDESLGGAWKAEIINLLAAL